jgi:hypothetical protein
LLVHAAAFAVTIRADRLDSQYVALGRQYTSVGRFEGATNTFGFVASGTLIAPDWVLTAGHVVDHTKSLTFTIGGASYTAASWLANPSWNGNLFAGYDIGLVYLTRPVTGIQPALLYTGSAELGKVGAAVGYGMTGTGLTGAKTLDLNRRAEQNMIDRLVNARLFISDFDNPRNLRDNSLGSFQPLDLEGLIAPGDSGGGVFITVGAGASAKTFLAGVNSFVGAYDGKPDSDYGDISGHTRVSAFGDWIKGVIGTTTRPAAASGASTASNAHPAFSPVPEPATFTLLAMGGLAALLCIRFSRRTSWERCAAVAHLRNDPG